MSLPQWITPAGLLFTATEAVAVSLPVEATGTNVTYSLISGSLPSGLTFNTSTGVISGAATNVLTATMSQFVIRAKSVEGVVDRTFKVGVDGNTAPLWSTSSTFLPIGYGGKNYALNRQWINYKLSATDLSTSTVNYTLVGGVLPPGLSLSKTGTISGFLSDRLTFDAKGISTGAYDNGKFDAYGYDPVLTFAGSVVTVQLTSQPKTYQFKVNASDGYLSTNRDFYITVANPDSFRADNVYLSYSSNKLSTDQITVDSTNLPPPQFLNGTDLGTVRADNNIDCDVSAYDLAPLSGTITYAIITSTDISTHLPNGIQLDTSKGHLYGYLSYQPAYTKIYNIPIAATKYSNDSTATVTTINTFTLRVAGNVYSSIEWITDEELGVINSGSISDLAVKAQELSSNYNVKYQLVDGTLPPGLMVAQDGSITGRPTYGAFGSFRFTVLASDVYGLSAISKEFHLVVDPTQITPYTQIYIKTMNGVEAKNTYKNFINDSNVFDPNLIYRYYDTNFGVQSELKMYLEYGIEVVKLEEYHRAMSLNFYKTSLYFGDIKVAIAQNANKETVYEAVYLDILDGASNSNGDSVANLFYQNNVSYNPFSITNIRNNLESIALIKNNQYVKIKTNEYDLPLFMRTPQGTNYSPTNYSPVVVICYALPGQGVRMANRIRRSGFNFKQFSFDIDRIIVQNSLDNSTAKYLLMDREHISDTIAEDNLITGIEGFTLE
jgi:Putative Ig domain